MSALVLVMLLRKYPLGEIVGNMRAGNPYGIFPIAFAFSVLQILLIALWESLVYRSLVREVRWRDLARVKAGCAVLQAVAYAANMGAYGAWIARATGIGVRNAVALIVYFNFSDLVGGSIVLTASVWIGHADVHPFLRYAPPIVAVVVFLALTLPRRVPLDPRAEASVFRVFLSVPRLPGALQMLGRTLNAMTVGLATWAAARSFGLIVPLPVMIVYIPVVMVVGALPINIAGFGPVQGAWLLFSPWAPGPKILAFQVLWQVSLMVSQVLRGLPFVRSVMAEVAEGRLQSQVVLGAVSAPPSDD